MRRQRSNIAHELAHCFLGHDCTAPLADDGERSRDSEVEEEAVWLAGVLLVPNEAAIHIVQNALGHQQKHYTA
jgi:Zn-dependent peptidase ImmA (M78 family)